MSGQGTYKFKKNDTLEKIAKSWGVAKASYIWDDPMNKSVKSKRKKPDALVPGDILHIPYTLKQKKAILEKKLHYLDLIDGEAALAAHFAKQSDLFAAAARRADARIKELQKSRDDLEKYLLRIEKDVKATSQAVDIAAAVLTLLVGLSKTAAKAAKASGDELVKLNKEAMKQITGVPAEKAKGAAKEAGVKYLLDPKNEISMVGLTVGTLSESFDKMTSPSFWATTISRMRTSGKGLTWESWVDASTFDLKQEITNQLHMADRTFIPAKKAAIRDAQSALKRGMESTRLAKSAIDRTKIYMKKKAELPDF